VGFVRFVISTGVAEPREFEATRHTGGSVGGYLEFEAETLEEAIQLATRVPAAGQGGAVEVRASKVYW
jgi:hypothetical protein